ncbi:MAG: 50S ribosomal protein L6 [Verrucomicrobiales bacterium]|nr:50S ribosomal protein L6 [Verrucomicrobiales bacterium]
MSRIGRQPIPVPANVKVAIQGQNVSVEGPKGKLSHSLPRRTAVRLEKGQLLVSRESDEASVRALHGLSRALLNNMIKGVSEGYVKRLEIQGVGFKAAVQGRAVTLNLGYSHPISYSFPEQIKVTVDDNTRITVEGPDKQVVGQVAADLRGFYPPEPYKGKGVRYFGERVIRKEGKTVQ